MGSTSDPLPSGMRGHSDTFFQKNTCRRHRMDSEPYITGLNGGILRGLSIIACYLADATDREADSRLPAVFCKRPVRQLRQLDYMRIEITKTRHDQSCNRTDRTTVQFTTIRQRISSLTDHEPYRAPASRNLMRILETPTFFRKHGCEVGRAPADPYRCFDDDCRTTQINQPLDPLRRPAGFGAFRRRSPCHFACPESRSKVSFSSTGMSRLGLSSVFKP